MSTQGEQPSGRLDWLKWLVVLVLVGGGIYGNWYFTEESLLYRVIALLVLALIVLAVAAQTALGRSALVLLQESRTEIRKVIWPTPQETNQTTLIVVVLVLFVALILWLLDWGLGAAVEDLIG